MDILTVMTSPEPGQLDFDWQVSGADLSNEGGLFSSIVNSLFLDRRATDDDKLPDNSGDKKGWLGDSYDDDKIGSRLWLLARSKQLQEVMLLAEDYARESLQWMVDDGVVDHIDVAATNPKIGWLALTIKMYKPNSAEMLYNV